MAEVAEKWLGGQCYLLRTERTGVAHGVFKAEGLRPPPSLSALTATVLPPADKLRGPVAGGRRAEPVLIIRPS